MALRYDENTQQWVDDGYTASGEPNGTPQAASPAAVQNAAESGTASFGGEATLSPDGNYYAYNGADPSASMPAPSPASKLNQPGASEGYQDPMTTNSGGGGAGDGIKTGGNNADYYWSDYGTRAMDTLQQQQGQYQGQMDQYAQGAVGNALGSQGNLQAIGNAAQQNAYASATAINDRGNAYSDALYYGGSDALNYGLGQGGGLQQYGQNMASVAGQNASALGQAGSSMLNQGSMAQGRNVNGAYQQGLTGIESTEGPSAAQAQLAQATNANQANALAMARSGRGWGGSAGAMQQAAAQRVGAQQESANQSAVLRAQENAAWRQRKAQNLATAGQMATQSAQVNDAREQGLYGLGMQGLSGQADAGLGAAQLGVNATQAGAALGQNAYNQYQAGLGQASQVGMQGGEFGAQLAQQGLQQQGDMYAQGAGLAQQGYGMGGQLANMGATYGLQNLAQQGQTEQAGLGYNEQYWQRRLQAQSIAAGLAPMQQQQQNAMIGAGMSMGGMALSTLPLLLMLSGSDRNMKEDIKPANSELVLPEAGSAAPAEPTFDPFSQGVGVSGPNQMGAGANAGSDAAKAAAGAGKAAKSAASKAPNPYATPLSKRDQLIGGLGSSLAAAGSDLMRMPAASFNPVQIGGGYSPAMITSDKREKEALDAIESAPGYSYNYKDPEAMGATDGRQYGVMAQDLEKTPAGRSVVHEVGGHKMVDTSRLTLVNTAAMNALTDRLAQLESRVSGKSKAA